MQTVGSQLQTVLDARDRKLITVYELYEPGYEPGSSGFDPRDAVAVFSGVLFTLPFGPVVYRRQVVQGPSIKKTTGKQENTVTIRFSNVSEDIDGSRYMAKFVTSRTVEGMKLAVREFDLDVVTAVGNSIITLTNSIVLFAGRCDKPDGFNRATGTITAKQDLGTIEAQIPARQFQPSCPLEFKGPECLGTELLSEKSATYQAAATCNFSFGQCSDYGNTEFFQGIRVVQITSSFLHKEHEGFFKKFLRYGGFGLVGNLLGRKRQQTTVSNSIHDGTPYGTAVPLIFGRWYKSLIPLQFQDIGTSINFLMAACRGKISDFINVFNQNPAFTQPIGVTKHRGEYGGDGSQTQDTVFSEHGFFSRLAYLTGYVNGSDIVVEDPAPDIAAVIAGIIPDRIYFDIDPDGTGKLLTGSGGTTSPGTSRSEPGTAAASYDAAVLADAPEGYWKLEEEFPGASVPNSDCGDSSGNGHNGALLTVADGITTRIAGPIETDPVSYGMSGPIARIPSTGNAIGALLPSSNKITLECWAMSTGSGCEMMLSMGGDVADTYMSFGERSTGLFADNVVLSLETVGGGYKLISQSVSRNVWHHVVGVRDGPFMGIYVDGCLSASRGDLDTTDPISPTSAPWRLGYITNLAFGAVFWSAGLSRVAVYPNAVLSADAVANHYASGKLIPTGCPGEDWTDNPVDHARYVLTEPSLLNNPDSAIDDIESAYAAAYNCGAIKDETNGERCLLPNTEVTKAGIDYKRYTSTGLLGPLSFESTRTQIPAGVPARALVNAGLSGNRIGEYEFFDPATPPTSASVLTCYRKRFTCNLEVSEQQKALDFFYDRLAPTARLFLRWNTKGQIVIDSERPADWTKLRIASIAGATSLTVNDVLPWKTTLGSKYLLDGKLHIGGDLSEVRPVTAAVYSDLGDAITLATSASGGAAATPSGSTLSGGSATVKSSGTVTITGTLADGATITVTIDGIDCVLDLVSGESSSTIGHRMACVINADPVLKEYIEAHASTNVVTIYSKIGVLTLSSALEEAHDTGTELTRVMMSLAGKALTYANTTRANVLDGSFGWPFASRQSLVNQIKTKYREAVRDFGYQPLVVNDFIHQRATLKTNPFEVDHSAIDNYNTSARLCNGLLNKFRAGDRFYAAGSTGRALLLDEGDVICASDDSGPWRNVLIRLEEISINTKMEVSMIGRLYSRDQYSDLVANPVDIQFPSSVEWFDAPPPDIQFNGVDFPPNGLTQSTDGGAGITSIRGGVIFGASLLQASTYAEIRLVKRGGVTVNEIINAALPPNSDLEGTFEFLASVDGLYTVEARACNQNGCSATVSAPIVIGFGTLFGIATEGGILITTEGGTFIEREH